MEFIKPTIEDIFNPDSFTNSTSSWETLFGGNLKSLILENPTEYERKNNLLRLAERITCEFFMLNRQCENIHDEEFRVTLYSNMNFYIECFKKVFLDLEVNDARSNVAFSITLFTNNVAANHGLWDSIKIEYENFLLYKELSKSLNNEDEEDKRKSKI